MNRESGTEISDIEREWKTDRWNGIVRPYTAEEVCRLRGSIRIDHTLARLSSEKLWNLLRNEQHLRAFASLNGDDGVRMVRAGLKVIYLGGQTPSLQPRHSMLDETGNIQPAVRPETVVELNRSLLQADQLHKTAGNDEIDWLAPVVAEGEAGTEHSMQAYESAKAMIEAGAAGLYFGDMIDVGRANPYVDRRALISTSQFISNLVAARLASDVMGVPTVLIAKTGARNATLLTNDSDERDYRYATGERTELGHWWIRGSLETAIERAQSLAPFADMLSFEAPGPDIEDARKFSSAVLNDYPDKLLVYSCSPAQEWINGMTEDDLTAFHERLGRMGYRLQMLAGTHPAGVNSTAPGQYGNPPSAVAAMHMNMQKNSTKQELRVNALTNAHDALSSLYFDEVSKLTARVPRFQYVPGITWGPAASAETGVIAQKIADR